MNQGRRRGDSFRQAMAAQKPHRHTCSLCGLKWECTGKQCSPKTEVCLMAECAQELQRRRPA